MEQNQNRWEGKYPLISRLVAEMGKPLTFMDLETTSARVDNEKFGIAEIAYVAFMPDGKVVEFSSLINPEFPMEPKAAEITGLTDADLRDKPVFAQLYPRAKALLERSVISGFNVREFDIPGILKLMERRGLGLPEKVDVADVRDLWASVSGQKGAFVKGKLTEVAEKYGCSFDGAHRAMADVGGCIEIMEEMLWRHGKDFVLGHLSVPGRKVSAENGQRQSMPGEDLTEREIELKTLIDKFLASAADGGASGVGAFSAELAMSGWRVNISQYGASFVKDGEKTPGSRLGKGYGWKDLESRVNGVSQGQEQQPPTSTPTPAQAPTGDSSGQGAAATGGRQSFQASPNDGQKLDAESLRSAILEIAEKNGKVTMQDVVSRHSTAKFAEISMMLGDMLFSGTLKPEHVADVGAQKWLLERWATIKLPGDSKLKPMLERAKAMGAPRSVDYVQLRAAMLSTGEVAANTPGEKPWKSPTAGQETSQGNPQPPQTGRASFSRAAASAKPEVGQSTPRTGKFDPLGGKENKPQANAGDGPAKDISKATARAAAGELEWMEQPETATAMTEGADTMDMGDPSFDGGVVDDINDIDGDVFWGESGLGLDESSPQRNAGPRM